MEKLREEAENVLKLVSQRRYKVAFGSISPIIDSIQGNSEEETELLFSLLAARAQCAVMLDKSDIAIEDANRIIKSYNELRKTPIENDPLKIHFANAHFRLGQVFESKENIAAALGEYSIAKKNASVKEIDQGFRMFLQHVGVPSFSTTDDDVKPYRELVELSYDQDEFLVQCLKLKLFLKQNQITEQGAKKLNSRGVGRIIFPLMRLFIYNTKIVEALSDLGIQFFADGVYDFSNLNRFVPSLKDISPQLLSKILKFIKAADDESMKKATEAGIYDILEKALDYNYEGAELEDLLYSISSCNITQELTCKIGSNMKYIDALLKIKNNCSLVSLSKVAFVPAYTKYLEGPKNCEWILDYINDKTEVPFLSAASIILSRSMVVWSAEQKKGLDYKDRTDVSEEEKNYACRVVEKLHDIAKKYTKNPEIISNFFLTFGFAVRGVPQFCVDKKVHITASLMLAVHSKEPHVAMNCLSFFIFLLEAGFKVQINLIPNVQNNVLAALKNLNKISGVVQNGTALLIGLGHPDRHKLYQQAIKSCPDSAILKRYSAQLI